MLSNLSLFRLINDVAGRWHGLDLIGIFCSQYLWVFMTLAVVVLSAINFRRWKNLVIVSIGSAIIARGVIVSIIKWLYDHPRPDAVLSVHELVKADTVNSFPSGHTTFVFALAMGIYLYNKKLGSWFFVLAVLASVARVFVGVHWPYDVIAGAVLGTVTAYICNWLYIKYFRTRV